MWFVSKKKYDAMVAERDKWDGIAAEAVAQNGRLLDSWGTTIEEMKSIQELKLQLAERNEGLLARVKELEAELEMARQDNQRWADDLEELDLAYGRLETDYDRLCEERDHYEERCRYLEGEMEDKEELEAKLDFVIKQRDYYYDLLESTSEVEEKDE